MTKDTFTYSDRMDPITEVVVHESVTRTADDCVRVLKRRNLGVHIIINEHGKVYRHNDYLTQVVSHAKGHNRTSVGIEVINPYYPKYTRAELPHGAFIDAPWAHKGQYTLPTFDQCLALYQVISVLLDHPSLNIPNTWVGHDAEKSRFALGPVKGADDIHEGVLAHHYFDHADGAFPVLCAFLFQGRTVGEYRSTYQAAIKACTGAKGAVSLEGLL